MILLGPKPIPLILLLSSPSASRQVKTGSLKPLPPVLGYSRADLAMAHPFHGEAWSSARLSCQSRLCGSARRINQNRVVLAFAPSGSRLQALAGQSVAFQNIKPLQACKRSTTQIQNSPKPLPVLNPCVLSRLESNRSEVENGDRNLMIKPNREQ